MKKTKSVAELLAIRKEIKDRKPAFIRQDAHKQKKLAKVWRRPKGLHSKVRECIRGYVRHMTAGYGSPKAVRGLHKTGLLPVVVASSTDLKKLDKVTQGAILSSHLGSKKRLAIIKEALQLKLAILNLDPQKYQQKMEEKMKQRQEGKKQQEKKEEAKPVMKKEDAKVPEEKEETAEGKEKKEQERREHEKVLTKRS